MEVGVDSSDERSALPCSRVTLVLSDCQLGSAFEAVRGNPATSTISLQIRCAETETPGGSITGHRTSQVGVWFETVPSFHFSDHFHLAHLFEWQADVFPGQSI
jgi:hypothetical protein